MRLLHNILHTRDIRLAKVAPDQRTGLMQMLKKHPNLNSLYRISNNDLLGEVAFTNPSDEEIFYVMLREEYKADVARHDVVLQLVKENLLTGVKQWDLK